MSFSQRVRAKGGCLVVGLVDWGECDGPIEAHHLIPQQRIKHMPRSKVPTALKAAMLRDPRNGVPLCRKHHHMVTIKARFIPAELVPPEAIEFAWEYKIEWALEREVPGLTVTNLPDVSDQRETNARRGRAARRKGKRGELEVVRKFREYGFEDAARSQRGVAQTEGDVQNVPDMTEIRRRETLHMPKWIAECRDKRGDREWALVFRRSNEPWSVAIDLDHYLDLLARAHGLRPTYDDPTD